MRANRVQKRASLHEKAVQAVAKGEVAPVATRRRKPPERPAELTKHIKLHDMALAAVREIIETSSYTRYEIIDELTAVVR